MLRLVMMSLIGLMILVLVACGAAATPQSEQPATSAPVATSAPQAAVAPATSGETLEQAAARRAGGPGAIYVGDLSQLVGPAPLEVWPETPILPKPSFS